MYAFYPSQTIFPAYSFPRISSTTSRLRLGRTTRSKSPSVTNTQNHSRRPSTRRIDSSTWTNGALLSRWRMACSSAASFSLALQTIPCSVAVLVQRSFPPCRTKRARSLR
jgi:hypothetical protein